MPLNQHLSVNDSTFQDSPILLIDKNNFLTESLARELKKTSLPIIVSYHKPLIDDIIHLSFNSKLPKLPQTKFLAIIVVYKGEKTLLKSLNSLLKNAQVSSCGLVFITDRFNLTEKIIKKLTKYSKSRILVYGDIFGYNSNFSKTSILINQAVKHKKIILTGTGLSLVYPLPYKDLIHKTLEIIFGNSNSYLYFVSYSARTEMSFVRMLQRINPMIKVDFHKGKLQKKQGISPDRLVPLQPMNIPLEDRIKEALNDLEKEEDRKGRILTYIPPPKKMLLEKMVLGGVYLLLLPIIIITLCISVGLASVGIAAFSFEKGNLPLSQKSAWFADQVFQLAIPSEQFLSDISSQTGVPIDKLLPVENLEKGKKTAELFLSIANASSLLGEDYKNNSNTSLENAKTQIKKAIFALQELQAQDILPLKYREKLKQDERSISLLSNLLDSTPNIFGYEGKKSYGILIQDNTQLRAGGGFIRTFATVELDKGIVNNYNFLDIYEADGLLKGHIDPPYFLQRYLGAAHLFFRDSNTSLDSSVNATQAAKFIALETDKKVDGIISLDLSFLRSLLRESGPITVTGFGVVTSETLFSQVIQSSESLSGGNENNFLIKFTEALFEKLNKKPLPPLVFGRLLALAIYQKHALITSMNTSIQPYLIRGKVISSPKYITSGDIISIFENNISENHANYFIKRNLNHKINLKPDKSASSSMTILYINTSGSEGEGGEYSSYVNLILPQNSKLLNIQINGTKQLITKAITDPKVYQDISFKAPKGLEVTEESIFGKKIYSFLINVKEKEEREITIDYEVNGASIAKKSNVLYLLNYFKQPGVEEDEYSLTLNYPKEYKPIKSPKDVVNKNGQIYLERGIREDEEFKFEFATRK